MSRITVVQHREYRQHQLEIEDRGKSGHRVTIYPPARLGGPRDVVLEGQPTLAELVQRAREEIDEVMGPRPPPRGGYSRG